MSTLLLSIGTVVVGGGGLISLLIWLLVFALVVWLIFYIVGLLPLHEPTKKIVTIILALGSWQLCVLHQASLLRIPSRV